VAHAYDTTNFASITRRINGGLNGMTERLRYLEAVLAEIGEGE
jgi:predicted chitinase